MAHVRFTYIYDELISINCFEIRDIQFSTSSTYLGHLDRRGKSQMGQNATNFEQPGRARAVFCRAATLALARGRFQSFGLRLPSFSDGPESIGKDPEFGR